MHKQLFLNCGSSKMNVSSMHRQVGFTLVEIMIVVAMIGLLSVIALPNLMRSRSVSQKKACLANIRTIEGAKDNWAIERMKINTDVPTDADLFGSANFIKNKPSCPANGEYTLNDVGTKPTCSVPDHNENQNQAPRFGGFGGFWGLPEWF